MNGKDKIRVLIESDCNIIRVFFSLWLCCILSKVTLRWLLIKKNLEKMRVQKREEKKMRKKIAVKTFSGDLAIRFLSVRILHSAVYDWGWSERKKKVILNQRK